MVWIQEMEYEHIPFLCKYFHRKGCIFLDYKKRRKSGSFGNHRSITLAYEKGVPSDSYKLAKEKYDIKVFNKSMEHCKDEVNETYCSTKVDLIILGKDFTVMDVMGNLS